MSIDSYFLSSSLVIDNAGGLSLSASGTSIGIATAGISVGAGNFLVIGNELISLASASVGVGQITGISRGSESTSATEHVDGAAVKYLTKTTAVATVTADISDSQQLQLVSEQIKSMLVDS